MGSLLRRSSASGGRPSVGDLPPGLAPAFSPHNDLANRGCVRHAPQAPGVEVHLLRTYCGQDRAPAEGRTGRGFFERCEMSDQETIKREGLAAVPWAWIAFWLALAIGQIGMGIVSPGTPGVSITAGCEVAP